MQKYILCLAISIGNLCSAHAQENPVVPKNTVKVNLSALLLRNYSVQYERQVGKKGSANLNVQVMPFGKLPFVSTIRSQVDISEIDFDKFQVGSFGIVPEYRFYLGKQALKGFYLGLFGAYHEYKMNVPITYTVTTKKTGVFDGKVQTTTGGLQLGAQFRLSKKLSFDWWIIGPNAGSGSGDLVYTGSLDPAEQQALRDQLEKIKNDAPFGAIKSYNVTSSGATIRAEGPVFGLRGLGFNLGLRF